MRTERRKKEQNARIKKIREKKSSPNPLFNYNFKIWKFYKVPLKLFS